VMCVQYRCWYRSIFSDTDTESIPVVSADTEYPMPVSVSPYNKPFFSATTVHLTFITVKMVTIITEQDNHLLTVIRAHQMAVHCDDQQP